jgi:hypothetical protein
MVFFTNNPDPNTDLELRLNPDPEEKKSRIHNTVIYSEISSNFVFHDFLKTDFTTPVVKSRKKVNLEISGVLDLLCRSLASGPSSSVPLLLSELSPRCSRSSSWKGANEHGGLGSPISELSLVYFDRLSHNQVWSFRSYRLSMPHYVRCHRLIF